jgi:hypothetical protein
MEPREKQLRDAVILLMLIAQSENDLQQGRWLSQAQAEQEVNQR